MCSEDSFFYEENVKTLVENLKQSNIYRDILILIEISVSAIQLMSS